MANNYGLGKSFSMRPHCADGVYQQTSKSGDLYIASNANEFPNEIFDDYGKPATKEEEPFYRMPVKEDNPIAPDQGDDISDMFNGDIPSGIANRFKKGYRENQGDETEGEDSLLQEQTRVRRYTMNLQTQLEVQINYIPICLTGDEMSSRSVRVGDWDEQHHVVQFGPSRRYRHELITIPARYESIIFVESKYAL